MPKLPNNDIFDNPFSSTIPAKKPRQTSPKRKPAPESETPKLSVVEPNSSDAPEQQTSQPIKKTVYFSPEQLMKLHTEVHRLQMQGKNGREANLSRVVATAIDDYFARR